LAKVVGPGRLDAENLRLWKTIRNGQCVTGYQAAAAHRADEVRQLPM
jgi:hypothetical protein